MKSPLAKRLIQARKHADITQEEAAIRCGWESQSRLGNYESGTREPKLKELLRLAGAYGVSYSWLTSGMGDMTDVSGTREQQGIYEAELNEFKSRFPVISWVQAGLWTESSEPIETGEWAPALERTSSRSFALKVRGDSMMNPNGHPSIPEGAAIIVDPEMQAENGMLVVARQSDSNEATFKKYVIDGDQRYLKPLNPQFPAIPINKNCVIIGVVKYAILKV